MDLLGNYIEISRLIPGTRFVRQIFCKKCKEVVFDLSENPEDSELSSEAVRFNLHMNLQHGLDVRFLRCEDQSCADCGRLPK